MGCGHHGQKALRDFQALRCTDKAATTTEATATRIALRRRLSFNILTKCDIRPMISMASTFCRARPENFL
jgi:hypothetical protein